jgi:hypothetical protein
MGRSYDARRLMARSKPQPVEISAQEKNGLPPERLCTFVLEEWIDRAAKLPAHVADRRDAEQAAGRGGTKTPSVDGGMPVRPGVEARGLS